jgi:hypothetical protein
MKRSVLKTITLPTESRTEPSSVFVHILGSPMKHSQVQSSSASRFTAGAAGFFILSQSGERPER